MSTRAERAQRRRESWVGEVVPTGAPKPLAYDAMALDERLMAFAALNARVWQAAGLLPLPALERSQWPGSIVEPASDG